MVVFSGERLFKLKDTHGISLDISLDKIVNSEKLRVDWEGYVRTARVHGRWDFQTIDEIRCGLEDAQLDKNYIDCVLRGVKLFIQNNKHPEMTTEK